MTCQHRLPKDPRFLRFERRFAQRILVFSILWFALTGADTASWLVGGPAVLITSVLSLKLAPASQYRLSFAGALRFIIFFQYQSLRGGLDVMGRALSWQPRLDPGLIAYTTSLPKGSARIFFANTISLLPGTLSAELIEEQVTIHTLDQTMPIRENIQQLENHVAGLMRLPLPTQQKKC